MGAEPVTTADMSDGTVTCWCCGISEDPSRSVHLGSHPEVHLCLLCAHFVHQRAWEIEDEGRRGPAAFARGRIRNLRGEVVRRGWHQNRAIGAMARRLGTYLP